MPTNQSIRRRERGATSVFVAIGLTALIGSAALAIDLGYLYNVRTESQRVADLAAMAGAAAFVTAPGPSVGTTASAWATQFAGQNTVDQNAVSLQPTDIAVDLPSRTVDVTVRHTAATGSALSSVFGRVLGVQNTDIVTTASASSWPANAVQCTLPIFLVDRWDERGGIPWVYDPGIDYYEPFVPSSPTATYTGYDSNHAGTRLRLRPATGWAISAGRPGQRWYYPFDDGNMPGGLPFGLSIEQCIDPDLLTSMGQQIWVDPGSQIFETRGSLSEVIQSDPTAVWDSGMNCVVDAVNQGSGNPTHCRGSTRIRPAPIFDPRTAPGSAIQQVTVNNYTGVFIEQLVGFEIWVVLVGHAGVQPGAPPPTGGAASLLQVTRLAR